MFVIEPRLSPLLSSGDLLAESIGASVVRMGSSVVEVRGLPELARLFSNAPSIFLPLLGLGGDPIGGELLPSEIPPELSARVRWANSEPMGASSGLELRSVPRVRPIPALEDDIRRKSIGFASAGMWLELVGWALLLLWRVEWTDGAGALL